MEKVLPHCDTVFVIDIHCLARKINCHYLVEFLQTDIPNFVKFLSLKLISQRKWQCRVEKFEYFRVNLFYQTIPSIFFNIFRFSNVPLEQHQFDSLK